MQSIRSSILNHVKLSIPTDARSMIREENILRQLNCWFCSSSSANPDQIKHQVIELVKKFDKINASKVTETADFQKDLNLDSLDRVELVMALEEAFSVEIPDEKADKLTCCLDVANYIISYPNEKKAEAS